MLHQAPVAAARELTPSQRVARLLGEKAVSSGKLSAADVAGYVFDAVEANRFYIFSHPTPKALAPVQMRLEDVMQQRNPTDPFKDRPELGQQLRDALR